MTGIFISIAAFIMALAVVALLNVLRAYARHHAEEAEVSRAFVRAVEIELAEFGAPEGHDGRR